MEMGEPSHIFWAKRWAAARQIYRFIPHQPHSTILEINQMLYLTEVFSFMMEKGKVRR